MFHWDRMYKHEENIERDITERVEEYVCEFFDVETIFDLTDSDIDQIERDFESMYVQAYKQLSKLLNIF